MGTFLIGKNQQAVQGIPIGRINNIDERVKVLENQGTSIAETFETVLVNIKEYPATVSYGTGNLISTIVYTLPTGSITESVGYNGSNISSITLSGDTPSGINLTKTFGYTGDDVTSVTYS